MICSTHRPQERIACSTCGELHPVVQDDGCVVYYQCLPGHITAEDFLVALWEAGCDPQPVQRK